MKKICLFCLMTLFLNAQNFVSVSIAPQAFFVKKIAGDTLKINILIDQNTDEHTFELKPASMKELENSDIYFTIGLEFEKIFVYKFKENFKNLRFVDMQKNIHLKDFSMHSNKVHLAELKHEDDHLQEDENTDLKHDEHSHGQKDIHTWLDPNLVKIMATTIFKALSEKYPQNSELYQKNWEDFLKELDALDAELKALFEGVKSKEFIVYHPSWGYFAKAYDLEQIPVEIEAKEPKIKDLQALINFAKEKHIKAIFVQPGFPENAAKTLAQECGASVISINHLALDWDNELRKSAKALAGSLK